MLHTPHHKDTCVDYPDDIMTPTALGIDKRDRDFAEETQYLIRQHSEYRT